MASDLLLQTGWKFRKAGDAKWLPAKVPGTVHTDLMRNKIIPDPFYGTNESKVQWVGESNWEYQCSFFVQRANKMNWLIFEGLDTYATIYLNEKKIAETDNMFRTWKLNIQKTLHDGRNNLHIVFQNAVSETNRQADLVLPLKRPCENNRHYARKAQYHFGWDWAPKLITCGIWRSVKLTTTIEENEIKSFQNNIKLIQETDSIGQSFYFTINGKPTFMKGANWIPADVFLPRVSHEKYRSLLMAAKQANFNMLRVWGGGIYEDDYFYTLCDSLDIYVWQDFMFAGAMYPADRHFLENIKQEAIDNIKRLRKHKSIVLWCGNNEIDEAWHNWGWQKQFAIRSDDSAFLWKEYQQIFDSLLPSLVKIYDPGRSYVASSPIHGWGRSMSMTHGDSHYWGLWWGLQPLSIMKEKIPRFMSEYGMQAMPNWESILMYSKKKDWDTASSVMKTHQKHPTGYSYIMKYLKMEGLPARNFKEFVTASQALQSNSLKVAIEAQLHSNERCMGSLFWQLNDCWPVCSWSVIDYYGNKKPAYFTVKDLFGQKD